MLLLQTLFIAGLVLKDSCFLVSGSDVSLNVGEHITLACSPSEKPDLLFWFRQNLGQKPTLVSSLYTFDQRGIFYSTFKDNPRFSLTPDFHLIISDLRVSDTATYYCASSQHYELKFANGTNVIVKGTGLNTGGSNDVEAAGLSQVLNCSVRTESCVGSRGIHWFKQFEESMMGVVYGVCGSDMENSNSCLYELPVPYVSSEQTGAAYCAAVTCGHQLLGNQTKVKVSPRPPQMASLWGAVAFTYALLFALTLLLCCLNQRNKTDVQWINSIQDQNQDFQQRCASLRGHQGDGEWRLQETKGRHLERVCLLQRPIRRQNGSRLTTVVFTLKLQYLNLFLYSLHKFNPYPCSALGYTSF